MNSVENELNPSVKEALIQFRKSLSDVLPPDVTDNVLLKWLRAKNFHLKKSEELYRINLRCKQIFKFAELEKIWRTPEVIEKYRFANYLGVAKDGTPIRYIAMGRGDLKGFYMSLDAYDIGKYCVSEIEIDVKKCKEQSKKLGRDINEMTYVVDMGCFNLGQVMFSGIVEIGLDLLRMLQELFPEIWQNLLIVNAPFYFHTFFNIFKPILSYNFLSKVRVASRDQSASLLLKYIDADVLPEFLGGKRVDSKGNPMCAEFEALSKSLLLYKISWRKDKGIDGDAVRLQRLEYLVWKFAIQKMKFGGIVPEEYYLRNRSPLLPTEPGVEDYWVPPRGCLNIPVVVRKPNSTFHVEVRSEGGSLLAVILYRKFEFDPDEYIDLPGRDEFLDPSDKKHNVIQLDPSMHIHTHVAPINNYTYAPWPGIYIFRIDNSYNWFSGRRCIHRIRVEPPEKC